MLEGHLVYKQGVCAFAVDIKEGFWHTKICATFNRKLQKK